MSETPHPATDVAANPSEHDRLVKRPTPSELVRTTGRTLRFGTKALVRSQGHVLLVKERRDDGSTFWTLPGGGLAPGESPREALERELDEEIGCGCALGAIVARCRYRHTSHPDTTTVYSVFETTLDGRPTPNSDEGIVDHRWTHPTAVPPETLDTFETLLAGQVARDP